MPLEQEQIYVNDNAMFKGVINDAILLFCVLIAFVAVEILPILGMSNFIVNHNFSMRMILILIQILFMMSMLNTILHPPVSGFCIMFIVVILVIICVMCVKLVLMISTITAIITGIMWIITISIVVIKRRNDLVIHMRAIRTVVANIFSRS